MRASSLLNRISPIRVTQIRVNRVIPIEGIQMHLAEVIRVSTLTKGSILTKVIRVKTLTKVIRVKTLTSKVTRVKTLIKAIRPRTQIRGIKANAEIITAPTRVRTKTGHNRMVHHKVEPHKVVTITTVEVSVPVLRQKIYVLFYPSWIVT
jgi:hypothetical protein